MSAFLKRLYKFPCQKGGCKTKASVELVRSVQNFEDETMGYYCEACGKKSLRKYNEMEKTGIPIKRVR